MAIRQCTSKLCEALIVLTEVFLMGAEIKNTGITSIHVSTNNGT